MHKVKILFDGDIKNCPMYASEGSAGADLRSTIEWALDPGERKLIPTGVRIAIPEGYYGEIHDRSGWAVKHGITTLAGVIDPDYRGEICVVLLNTGDDPVLILRGERIAQIVFKPYVKAEFYLTGELPDTVRGDGGFGSTGA